MKRCWSPRAWATTRDVGRPSSRARCYLLAGAKARGGAPAVRWMARPPLNPSEPVFDEVAYDGAAVMEHGHDLYVRVIAAFKDFNSIPSLSQIEIDRGLSLTKHWDGSNDCREVQIIRRLAATERRAARRDDVAAVDPASTHMTVLPIQSNSPNARQTLVQLGPPLT